MGEERIARIAAITAELAPRLVLFARQRCPTPEDVVQEALLRLFQATPWPDDPAAWLYRVVRNLALNASRSRTRRNVHEGMVAALPWFQSDPAVPIDAEAAVRALEQLEPELREILVLRIWCEHGFRQIADLMGSSPQTVMRRFRAGLGELRERLGLLPDDLESCRQPARGVLQTRCDDE